jgi:molecular chaperone GrpE
MSGRPSDERADAPDRPRPEVPSGDLDDTPGGEPAPPGAPGAAGDPEASAEPAAGGVVADDPAEAARQRDEYLDMLRRVQADFENYKKRMVRQQTDLLERAAEGLVTRLLPVLDAFDLARAHLEAEGSPEGKALLQAAGLFEDTMAKEGLERVDTVGVEFDPTVHEAVEHQPAEDGGGAGGEAERGPVVSDVLRAGYRYKGRVVRPAMVRVRG